MISDVWEIETAGQKIAAENLSIFCEKAIKGDRKAQNYLKKLWGEKWTSIKEKLQTESSVWYVWYMDGVNAHCENMKV